MIRIITSVIEFGSKFDNGAEMVRFQWDSNPAPSKGANFSVLKLKEYLTNVIKVNSQFIESRKLMDRKRAGSIMFNIVEQINIKMGGANFYINLIL